MRNNSARKMKVLITETWWMWSSCCYELRMGCFMLLYTTEHPKSNMYFTRTQ